MPVYRKMDDSDIWLIFYPTNPTDQKWMVQPTLLKGTDEGFAYVNCDPPSFPENARIKRTWRVMRDWLYQPQSSVDCGTSI